MIVLREMIETSLSHPQYIRTLVVHKNSNLGYSRQIASMRRRFITKRGRKRVLLSSNWFLVGYFPDEEES
jgi:hypothetical protein